MTPFQNPALIIATSLLSGCAIANQNKVSVDYYTISGDSTAALDRQIREKGPRIGDGKHAVAVARIRINPKIRFKQLENGCKASYAKVNVDAKVTLPAWKERQNATQQLGEAWDNIDRYTRLHEAVHVSIAFRFAKDLEKLLLNAPAAPTCREAKANASLLVDNLLKAHDKAQRQFDADEQARIAKLVREQDRAAKRS